jgi:CheY-like chemotaxis protein/two-component sensor histidine kinase
MIRYVIDHAIPAQIITDEVRLSQIVTNLVGNAVKFSPQGGNIFMRVFKYTSNEEVLDKYKDLVLTRSEKLFVDHLKNGHDLFGPSANDVSMDQGSAPKIKLLFVISDEGVGIAEKNIKKLFTIFSQADTTTTRRFGGSGLGLAICRQLCTLLGGDIAVLSEEGVGSVFYFTINVEVPVIDWNGYDDRSDELRQIFHNKSVFLLYKDTFSIQICENILTHFGAEVFSFAPEKKRSINENLNDFTALLKHLKNRDKKIDILQLQINKRDIMHHGSLPKLLLNEFRNFNTHFNAAIVGYGCLKPQDFLEYYDNMTIDIATTHVDMLLNQLRNENNHFVWNTALQKNRPTDYLLDVFPFVCHPRSSQNLIEEHVSRYCKRVDSGVEMENDSDSAHVGNDVILVAEDNKINQVLLEKMLRKIGRKCHVSCNGLEAFEAFKKHHYQIILMDLHMPIMDGIEATKKIIAYCQENLISLPKIFCLTADVVPATRNICMQSGFDVRLILLTLGIFDKAIEYRSTSKSN